VKTWKTSTDPDYEAKKNRVLALYAIADGRRRRGLDDPTVVICCDEFEPLNLRPHPGKQWAPQAVGRGDQRHPRRRRRRATYTRPNGVRHLIAGYDLSTDKLYGHVKSRKARTGPAGWSAATAAEDLMVGSPSRSRSGETGSPEHQAVLQARKEDQ
jgi:hypothetical protein